MQVPAELRARALQCLTERDPSAKVAAVYALAEAVANRQAKNSERGATMMRSVLAAKSGRQVYRQSKGRALVDLRRCQSTKDCLR